MTLYVVRFTDRADQLAVRRQFLQAHIEWLDRHKDVVLVPGSLRPEPGQDAVGGLWVVEARDREQIERLIHTDPFWIHGLRQGFEILHWSKAFPDRKVLV